MTFLTSVTFSTAQVQYNLPVSDDVCPGETVTYSVTWSSGDPAPVNVIYHVTGEVQYIPNGNTVTITWGNSGGGTLLADCYDALNNYVTTNITNITIHPAPAPVISSNSIVNCTVYPFNEHGDPIVIPNDCWKVCEGSTVIYQVPQNSGSTYVWTAAGAISHSTNQNEFSVTWGTAGSGMVQITEINTHGCSTVVEQCISIVNKPNVTFSTLPPTNFNSGAPLVICEGATVYFFGQSLVPAIGSPINGWLWDFGDGNLATGQNVSHQYISSSSPGTYTVVLTVTNACGCSNEFKYEIEVTPDQFVEIVCATPVCEGGSDNYSTNAVCTEYQWSVTNGTLVPPNGPWGSSISVNWGSGNNGPGVLSLLGIGCTNNCNSVSSIVVPIFSTAFPISGPNPACAGTQQTYSVPLVPGTVYNWSESSGLGTIVHGQGTNEVVVEFNNVVGQAELIVDYVNEFLDCPDGRGILQIDIKETFELLEANPICEGESVSFLTDISIPNAVIWWKIFDSNNTQIHSQSGTNTSMTINPWNFGPGLFTISATTQNWHYCSANQSISFEVIAAPPAPSLPIGNSEVCPNSSHVYTGVPLPVHYLEWVVTNNGTTTLYAGNSVSILWGTSPYEIKLYQISNNTKCKSSDPAILSIDEIIPVIPMISGETNPCTNSYEIYSISNISTLHPDQIEWSIDPPSAGSIISGQGTASIDVQWNNTQLTAIIKLKIATCGEWDVPSGTGDYEFAVNIIGLNTILINVSGSRCSGNPNQTNFSVNGSFSGSETYAWDFGDGSTSTSSNPIHTYTLPSSATSSTNFPVTLEVNDNGCKATANLLLEIYPSPVFAITTNSINICPPSPSSATLTIITQQNPNLSFLWSTGQQLQTINVSSSGIYTATVTHTISPFPLIECVSQASIQILGCGSGPGGCGPDPNWTFSPSFNPVIYSTLNCTEIFLENGQIPSSDYIWDFGDGTQNALSFPNTSHIYNSAGIYQACLLAWDHPTSPTYCDRFCREVIIPLDADFKFTILCNPVTQPPFPTEYNVQFNDLSTFLAAPVYPGNYITNWVYEIEGPLPSTNVITLPGTQNPTTILEDGIYNVTLTIYDDNSNSCSKTINGLVIPKPPNPTFSVTTAAPYCEEQTVVQFEAINPAGYFTLLWDFDDPDPITFVPAEYFQVYDSGNPLTYQASRAFSTYGIHDVKLTVTDIYGCTYSHIENVNIEENKLFGAIDPLLSKICPGGTASLLYDRSSGNEDVYLWSNFATTNPISVSSVGQYLVTVYDSNTGCSFQPIKFADVGHENIPMPTIFGDLNYCLGETVQLSGDIGAFDYYWNIGTLSFEAPSINSDATIQITAPAAAGIYPISLTITVIGPTQTCSLTTYVDVTVYDLPTTPVIVATPANPLCEGTFTNLDVSASNSGNNFVNWSTGQSGNVIDVIQANTYQATFTNAAGCSSRSDISIHELPDLDWLVFGCFDYCREDEITIPGSINEFAYWLWEVHDVNGQYLTLDGHNSPVQDLQLGTLAPGVYTITLQVMDNNSGCRGFSEPILITVRSCPCDIITGISTEAIYCIGVDANGVGQYGFRFEVFLNSPTPLPGTFSLSSGTTGLGVTIFTQTVNSINSYLIEGMISFDFNFHVLEHCLVLVYDDQANPENSCVFPFCFYLPDCNEIVPCDFEMNDVVITCLGLNSNGDPVYNVNFSLLPPPGLFSTSFSTTAGTLTGFPASVNGSGPYSGTFTNNLPHDPELCIQINYFTLPDQAECFSYNCFGVPQCPGDPDRNALPIHKVYNGVPGLILAPNPTNGITEIQYNILGENQTVLVLYDTKGKLLKQWNLVEKEGKLLLNSQDYEPGIYLVAMKTQSQTVIVKKLVIMHQ